MQDQFGTVHEFKFPRVKPTVLTVADKKGSADIKDWAHPLAEKFGDKIEIAGLADVSAVPSPLRGMVKAKFKKAIQYPVMLDWKGTITSSFRYTKGEANVYLIAPDGRLIQHIAGKADVGRLKVLCSSVEAALEPHYRAKARSN